MLVAFARYSRNQSFPANKRFLLAMASGSVAGTVLGGLILNIVPSIVLFRC
jgi:hypothetical protein